MIIIYPLSLISDAKQVYLADESHIVGEHGGPCNSWGIKVFYGCLPITL